MDAKCALTFAVTEMFRNGTRTLADLKAEMAKTFPNVEVDDESLEALYTEAARRFLRGDPSKVSADVRAAKIALAKEVQRTQKTVWNEVASNLVRAGLLTGGLMTRTLSGNAVGNIGTFATEEIAKLPATMLDILLGGDRTVAIGVGQASGFAELGEEASKFIGDMSGRKAQSKAMQIMKQGAPDEALAQFYADAGVSKFDMVREQFTGNKVLDGYVNFVMRAQSAADQPFRAYAFKRSLVERATVAGWRKGLKGADLDTFVKQQIAAPSEEVMALAVKDTMEAIFANQNAAASTIKKAQQAPARLAEQADSPLQAGALRAVTFALDSILPFTTVPSNIAGRSLEYTPLGIVLGLANAATGKAAQVSEDFRGKALGGLRDTTASEIRRRGVTQFGRGVTGTALLYMGYQMAMNAQAQIVDGNGEPVWDITGDFDPNVSKGSRDREKALGRQPASIKIGDRYYRITDSVPGMLLALGATLQVAMEEDKLRETPRGAATVVGNAAVNVLGTQPALEGVATLADSTSGGATVTNFAGQMVGNAVPGFAADAANLIADARTDGPKGARVDSRKLSGDDPGVLDVAKGKLRIGAPTRYDALGRPVERANMFNRFGGTRERDGVLERELRKLRIGLTEASRKKSDDPGGDRNAAEHQERVRVVGTAVRETVGQVVQGEAYQSLPEAQRREVLERLIDKVKRAANAKLDAERQAARIGS